LLEDELMLQDAIVEFLSDVGYQVTPFSDGDKALVALMNESYDLLVLDINVPHIDGLALLEELQKQKIFTPTIYISAITNIKEITRAYELECFDYLKKPFHLQELLLHIERFIKNNRMVPQTYIKLSKRYSYDTASLTLLFDNIPQTLTKKQLEIMDLFAKNIGLVVSYDTLQEYAWDGEPVDNATIRAEINRLKKALKEELIINIRGLGYKIEK
jgi:DNA-binding response OmpR family regulator